METTKKVRSPNFSTQECMLLTQIMGEDYQDFGLSRHKVDKHKFNSKISSLTKKELWQGVENAFNANTMSTARTSNELQKKWENLIAKHRAIYSDYKRVLALTGSGPVETKYTLLTEAVMSVIGKECVSVAGSASEELDTTFSQLQRSQSRTIIFDENGQTIQDNSAITGLPCTTSASKYCKNVQKCVGEADDDDAAELRKLKKRKLQLQVEYLELQLKKLKEE